MRSLREIARFSTRVNSVCSPRTAPPAASFAQSRVLNMSAPAAVEVDAYKVGDSTNIKWHEGSVDSATREKAMNQKGCVLWFTGLSGSGKSTVAYTLEHALFQKGKIAQVLDGDNIRHGEASFFFFFFVFIFFFISAQFCTFFLVSFFPILPLPLPPSPTPMGGCTAFPARHTCMSDDATRGTCRVRAC